MVQYPLFIPDYLARVNLASKYVIILIPAYTHSHLNVEADYLSQGRLVPEWNLLPHIAQVALYHQDLPEMDLFAPLCTNQCQHYTSWRVHDLWEPWG